MLIEQTTKNEKTIALISAENMVITDTQSALDLAMSVKYETGAERIVINKNNISEEFFRLSSGMAGEILQKYVNYHVKIAMYIRLWCEYDIIIKREMNYNRKHSA